jgi:hypothetical protein
MSGESEEGEISQFKLTLGKPEQAAGKQDMTRIRHQCQRKHCCIGSTFSIIGSSSYNAMVTRCIGSTFQKHEKV